MWRRWPASVAGLTALMVPLINGCVPSPASRPFSQAILINAPSTPPADAQITRLVSELAPEIPGTAVVPAPPGLCGPAATPVARLIVPEQVLFATASDQPGPDAAATLGEIAERVTRDAPGAQLTVLGHTDSVGSEAYNLDLSKRRAVIVLHGLVARGLDPSRLTAVSVGKRQPVASNATPEGRARNRRVEFLIARCLAANLAVVANTGRDRALLDADEDTNRPAEVMRLDPAAGYRMAPLTAVYLRQPEGVPAAPAVSRAAASPVARAPSALLPPVGVARPAPAPHYQPRTLQPDVQRSPLGPAVPF